MRTKKTILTIPRENVTFCMSLPTSWSSLVLTFEWRRERLNQELGNCVVVRKKKYKMKYSCKKNFFVMSRQHHQSALFLQKKFCCWNMRQILYFIVCKNHEFWNYLITKMDIGFPFYLVKQSSLWRGKLCFIK